MYVYSRDNSGNWIDEITYIKASNTGKGDQFGISVSSSGNGNTLAVGASGEDGNGTGINPADNNSTIAAGVVYIY